ncbi:GLUG motif-containing protein [Heyndrickxia ginsengihumi]|uniref:GLUG motif-containing protein n=1 Tax=Heyndrickxia ginsengihumi TaxID=363870 RepID=UPI003D1B1EC9
MQGAGTQTDPYLVSTPQDLSDIRNNITAYYELVNDIDMSSFGNFTPITAISPFFGGTIDGKGYKIINLTINSASQNTGLIGRLSNGTIKNLGLVNVNITSSSDYVGALVGQMYGGNISSCYSTGNIQLTTTSKYFIGGLIGYVSNSQISDCYSRCNVSGNSYVGGFVGYAQNSSKTLTAIKNCYSIGNVSGNSYVGGFFGMINTNSGYAPSFLSCLFNYQTAGTTNYTVAGVLSYTTQQMQTKSSYNNWDFDNIWSINNDYPTLKIFDHTPTANIGNIEVVSCSFPIQSIVTKSIKATNNIESNLSPIFNEITRKTRTNRNVLTYTLPIDTNVQKSNRTVRSSTQNVTTFINPISALVERQTKTIQNLLTYISPLQAHTDVLIPLNTNVVNAFTSVIYNPSMATYSENMSDLNVINNPSFVEVVE